MLNRNREHGNGLHAQRTHRGRNENSMTQINATRASRMHLLCVHIDARRVRKYIFDSLGTAGRSCVCIYRVQFVARCTVCRSLFAVLRSIIRMSVMMVFYGTLKIIDLYIFR